MVNIKLNPDARNPALRPRKQIIFTVPSMTEQTHKDEVKIQNILKKYQQTGVLKHVNQYQGTYMDMASAPDFQEAQFIIAEAQSMFETVPSHIRDDFQNNAKQFLNFIQNPNNKEAIEAYGLDTSHFPVQEETTSPSTSTPNTTETSTEEQPDLLPDT